MAWRPAYQPQLPHTTWGSLVAWQRGRVLRAGASSFQADARRARLLALLVFFLGTAMRVILRRKRNARSYRRDRSTVEAELVEGRPPRIGGTVGVGLGVVLERLGHRAPAVLATQGGGRQPEEHRLPDQRLEVEV